MPLLGDLARFEASLISVLENRPQHCEVIVCHDGSYDDPFDLCDEVEFANADSDELVDLVQAGTRVASGRFVHVLGDSLEATLGWTDAALEKFEHADCGSVTPVIWNADSDRIMAAGWQDTAGRLGKAIGQGKKDAAKLRVKVAGAFLNGSFWRRELLGSLQDAISTSDVTEATAAYEYAARDAGWRCVIAPESNLVSASGEQVVDAPSIGRGATLRAVRGHFAQGGIVTAVQSSMKATLCNLAKPGMWMESLGQVFAPVKASSFAYRFNAESVLRRGEHEASIKFPTPSETTIPLRRAA